MVACGTTMARRPQEEEHFEHVKKPTEFKANHPFLFSALWGLVCDGSHEHERLEHGVGPKAAALWTWGLSSRIVVGIVMLKRSLDINVTRTKKVHFAFPEAVADTGSASTSAAPKEEQSQGQSKDITCQSKGKGISHEPSPYG